MIVIAKKNDFNVNYCKCPNISNDFWQDIGPQKLNVAYIWYGKNLKIDWPNKLHKINLVKNIMTKCNNE